MGERVINFNVNRPSQQSLKVLAERIKGVPANYNFEWSCSSYKPRWNLKTWVEATSLEEAQEKAITHLKQQGITSEITLTLLKIENKIYTSSRETSQG